MKVKPANPIIFEAFVWKHLLPHLEFPIEEFHRELISLCQYSRIAIAAPRFFAKSYYYSFFYPLFMALENPGIQILLVSSTGALAEKFLSLIRTELELNQSLQQFYGFQEPKMADTKGKWSLDELHLANGSVIMAKGAGKAIRGFHPNLIIGDDLEDDEMVLSIERRKKFDNWFWTDIMGTMGGTGQVIVLGTILHPESFLAEIVNKPPHKWVSRFYTARTWDGSKALWPAKFSLAALKDIELEHGTYYFNQEYMNTPISDDRRVFQDKWFQYVDKAPSGITCFSTVDPAISLEATADYTALITCGVDSDRNLYIMEALNQRWLPSEMVDAVFSAHSRFKSSVIGIESVGFQKLLKNDLEQERSKRRQYPLIRELKSDGRRKQLRIEGLQPFFESGKIFFVGDKDNLPPGMEELRTQLLRFPSARCHDDLADALAYQLDIIHASEAKVEQMNPESVYATILEGRRLASRTEYYGS